MGETLVALTSGGDTDAVGEEEGVMLAAAVGDDAGLSERDTEGEEELVSAGEGGADVDDGSVSGEGVGAALAESAGEGVLLSLPVAEGMAKEAVSLGEAVGDGAPGGDDADAAIVTVTLLLSLTLSNADASSDVTSVTEGSTTTSVVLAPSFASRASPAIRKLPPEPGLDNCPPTHRSAQKLNKLRVKIKTEEWACRVRERGQARGVCQRVTTISACASVRGTMLRRPRWRIRHQRICEADRHGAAGRKKGRSGRGRVRRVKEDHPVFTQVREVNIPKRRKRRGRDHGTRTYTHHMVATSTRGWGRRGASREEAVHE